ncbi:MAG: serine hydrolase [Eubacteriales bacterium]|nr:serine hydrolase [Eubacteriales bacterium]
MEQGQDSYEQMREARRRRRIMQARREKRRRRMIRLYALLAVCAVVVVFLIAGAVKVIGGLLGGSGEPENETAATVQSEGMRMDGGGDELPDAAGQGTAPWPDAAQSDAAGRTAVQPGAEDPDMAVQSGAAGQNGTGEEKTATRRYSASRTGSTQPMNGEVYSSYGIFVDLASDTILAERNSDTVINPASMTKILTVLTAAEQLEEGDLDDTFTITRDITDYSYVNDCSNAGFEVDEKVTVRDLFYGTILPSGGEAAAALATCTAGSLDAFVELMNKKLEELGLSGTAHFTNCVGLYDANHHCTVYDMAMILEAALDNELCREVLSAKTYTTSATDQHPEGIQLSNWFLRRIEDKDTGGHVVSAKTGYVVQSGNCAASYGVDNRGRGYICVTADATSSWRCIYDHVALYKQFSGE